MQWKTYYYYLLLLNYYLFFLGGGAKHFPFSENSHFFLSNHIFFSGFIIIIQKPVVTLTQIYNKKIELYFT